MTKIKDQYGDPFTIKIKEKQTRKVRLKYKSCCGCGCSDVTVTRTVPFDSPLQNGDRITETLPGDDF